MGPFLGWRWRIFRSPIWCRFAHLSARMRPALGCCYQGARAFQLVNGAHHVGEHAAINIFRAIATTSVLSVLTSDFGKSRIAPRRFSSSADSLVRS